MAEHFVDAAGLDGFAGGGQGGGLALAAAFVDDFLIADKAHIVAGGADVDIGGHAVGVHFGIGGHVGAAHFAHQLGALGRLHVAGGLSHQLAAGGFEIGLNLVAGLGGVAGGLLSGRLGGGRLRRIHLVGAFVGTEERAAAQAKTKNHDASQCLFHEISLCVCAIPREMRENEFTKKRSRMTLYSNVRRDTSCDAASARFSFEKGATQGGGTVSPVQKCTENDAFPAEQQFV